MEIKGWRRQDEKWQPLFCAYFNVSITWTKNVFTFSKDLKSFSFSYERLTAVQAITSRADADYKIQLILTGLTLLLFELKFG